MSGNIITVRKSFHNVLVKDFFTIPSSTPAVGSVFRSTVAKACSSRNLPPEGLALVRAAAIAQLNARQGPLFFLGLVLPNGNSGNKEIQHP